MSLAPVWITDAGSLGVAPEGKFYRIALEAEDPDFPGDPTKVIYTLIAGSLPSGVQVNTNGLIEGIPISVADVKGVPTEVAEDTTSKFAIRITDEEGRIADRTFTITITGQDKPTWVTPAGSIGIWAEGTEMSYQFEGTDLDPGDELRITLVTGSLPDGLTLSIAGLLSGFITPIPTGAQNFEFTLSLTDGKDVVLRTFDMDVSDEVSLPPYIANHITDLGTFRHDNYFAYKFDGRDPNGDGIEYELVTGAFPPGLTLNTVTGWLTGILPDIALTELDYTFSVRVFKTIDPAVKSAEYLTTMHLVGNIDTEVTWITDSDLGTIANGEISTLKVEAEHATSELFYSLKGGTTILDGEGKIIAYIAGPSNKLPQGLTLLPSGNIVGRTSFKTTTFDSGTTTFDEAFATRLDPDPTTFDLTYKFTVEAHSPENEPYLISVTREFTILLVIESYGPYNEIYCKALPPKADRELIKNFLTDESVIPPDIIYRNDDPFFASSTEVIYQHAYGMTPAPIETYFAALDINHYNKNVVLGEVKIARALDDNENVIYEVVYSQIVDTYVNQEGVSPPASINIKYPALDNGVPVTTVYPNSLENMREQVISKIGQSSKIIPRWMLSKQEDGEILGFTAAWVIAYTQPGKSKLLQYKVQEFLGTQLNLVDFEIDRYTIDSSLAANWEYITADTTNMTADSTAPINISGQWIAGVETTFDREPSLLVTVDDILRTADETEPTVDVFVNIQPPLPPGYIPRDPGLFGSPYQTVYDGGSTRFMSPSDTVVSIASSDQNDKYIMFPKKMIVNNKQ